MDLGMMNDDVFFFICARDKDCGRSLEPPHPGYPLSLFLSQHKKKFTLLNPTFLYVKRAPPGCPLHGVGNVMYMKRLYSNIILTYR